jgi:hypothetical protein
MATRFALPAAEPAVLTRHPVLAGWDRADRPDRARLTEFLTAVEEDAEAALATIAGDLALNLTLALPDGHPLTRHPDLDNYLLPVVSRLGQRRIPAVFAEKVHADTSTLTVAPARLRPDDEPPQLQLRASGSYEHPAWQAQVFDACAAAVDGARPSAAPVQLDLAFGVSSLRNWTTLWKPTIDALGPLLGVPDPERPLAPNDDRVVRLGLHRTIDDSLGHDVAISAWWTLLGG